MGLSRECVQCPVATICVGVFLEKCEEVLGLPSSNTTASSSTATSEAAAANFSALLEKLDLEPSGGVRASRGYVTVENVSQRRLRSRLGAHGELLPFIFRPTGA
ncbi:unnamed protein product [Ectocarpus sp. 4 AP-2014]